MYINLANIDFGGESGGSPAVLQETTIETLLTETSKVVTPPEGVDGFNKVTVTHAPVETLTEATITQNGEVTITPSEGYDATLGVTVNVQVGSSSEYSDVDGIKYTNSTITGFPEGWKFAPRTDSNCANMFQNCNSLTTVPLFDTSNVTSMNSMFSYCTSLTTVPLFDTSNVTNMNSMFIYCTSLTTLGGFAGLKVDFLLSISPLLTHDSLLNVINEAADVTASPKTLTFGETNLAKLTDEEKAIATNKGWTLA